VNGFILASEAYHDLYRWPLVDRRVFERWCEGTAWGQLFLRYATMGPIGDLVRTSALESATPASPHIH
jgi:hypothetical protein